MVGGNSLLTTLLPSFNQQSLLLSIPLIFTSTGQFVSRSLIMADAALDFLAALNDSLAALDDSLAAPNVRNGLEVLTLCLNSLTDVYGRVTSFVDHEEMKMATGTEKLLEAFYEATLKAGTAAQNIQSHGNNATIELEKLCDVIDAMAGDEQSRGRALEVLKLVKPEVLILPESDLADQLQEAIAAFENVIEIAQEVIDHAGSWGHTAAMVLLVSAVVCLVVLSACYPAVAVVVAGKTAVAAIGAAGVIAFGSTVATTTALVEKLRKLTELMKQRRLALQAMGNAGEIILGLERVRNQVKMVQEDLRRISNKMTTAQMMESLENLKKGEFVNLVKQELEDLKTLNIACRNLIQKVQNAYSSLMGSKAGPNMIVQRVLTKG